MAIYTIELKDVIESRGNIFNFAYPFYDESKRHEFERAFIQHFYFREIGQETIDRFMVYLRDKMFTVFPYYNELLKTATIEYDVENPYNLTETYTRKTDSKGKSMGAAYSVDRRESDQNSTGASNRKTEGAAHSKGSSDSAGSEKTTNTGSATETVHGVNSADGSATSKNVKKFLDTPQGLIDLDSTDYLTNLTQEESETNNNQSSTSDSEKKSDSRNETVRDSSTLSNQKSVTNETGKEEEQSKTTVHNEDKGTNDTNTRAESVGEQVEQYTMTRKGNIGVNPASYEIDAHIKTQKTLKRIYEMFFDECEDLFMLVF